MRGYSDLEIIEQEFSKRIKGLYIDDTIALNKNLSSTEKNCVLAEELGHYHTSYGDITDQSKIENVKQEKRARNWGYEKIIPIQKLIDAYQYGCRNRYEIAVFFDVTEEFLDASILHYREKYGLCYTTDKYVIYLDPLGILTL
jgi:Zn-dependent peptidase ImmA (M78 family)